MRKLLTLIAVLICMFTVQGTALASGPFEWGIPCGYTRSAEIDTIKYPGTVGISHLHDFSGSDFTRNTDTFSELTANDTTSCEFANGAFPKADQSLYWSQALYRTTTGNKVPVKDFVAYYRTQDGIDYRDLHTYPNGWKYIAGDSTATTPQEGVVDWGCGGGGGANNVNPSPVDCDPNGENPYVKLRVKFPSCLKWDTLDSADHQSHAVYPDPVTGCPQGFGREVPALHLIVRYDTSNGDNLARGAEFDDIDGVHADFINGWDSGVFRTLNERCQTPDSSCSLRP